MERFQQVYGISLTKKKLWEIIRMLMALEAVFAFSYLGYIELPRISTTTQHVLVIVAAMMLGARGSVAVALVFAATSMWIGTYTASQLDRLFSPFVSGMPLGSLMLAAARVVFAAVCGGLYGLYFRKPRRHVYLGIGGIAVVSTFLHGLCIFGALYAFFPMLRQMILENLLSYPMFRDWLSYVLAAAGCCCVHYALSRESVKRHMGDLCEANDLVWEPGHQKLLIYAEIGAVITGILCVLFLRKVIFRELALQKVTVEGTLRRNLTAFLLQTLAAFVGLFSIVCILIRWVYEYYTSQRIRMNRKLLEQRVQITIDPLTGVFSRLAYHEAMEQYSGPLPEDLTVFLMDINGLKGVNDALGHSAGDELICGAAHCITQAVGDRGKTFRIGGDEFVVFGNMQRPQAQEILTTLTQTLSAWSGTKVKALSLSTGCAFAADYPTYSIEKLTREADKAMYAQKQAYYHQLPPTHPDGKM